MLSLSERLARQETEADRREFLRGIVGIDHINIVSLAAGWLSASLLLKGK